MATGLEPSSPPELIVRFDGGCPVKATLDVLGRKWAFLVLRNIGLYRVRRFNEMLRITPGLTKRILAMRLKELERGGFIRVVERSRNSTRWGLTEKGEDALPILMTLVHFGSKWYAEEVFADRRPRALSDVFERSYISKTLGGLTAARPARTGGRARANGAERKAPAGARELFPASDGALGAGNGSASGAAVPLRPARA